ncbi:MAG: D-alanine--D-alanine ligase family protein [Halanaerobiaceae bacterium]
MKIGFCYDIEENHPQKDEIEDMTAEYESKETIQVFTDILANMGEVIKLPYHPDLFQDLKKHKPDVVFNITESWGSRNRESFVPNLCEILNIPYTGSDGLGLGISLDKALTKHIASSLGINTPDFYKVNSLEELKNINFNFPLFIKPNNEGSSIGIRRSSQVNNREELKQNVKKLLRKYKRSILIEEFIPGREFVVAILGNRNLEVFPVAEILVEGGNFPFYSYEYKGAHQKTIECPAEIEPEKKEQMIKDTINIFKGLGCRDIARADFKLDEEGNPFFLEINPLPGLSPYYSVYPRQAEVAGMDIESIIERLINFALSRKNGGNKNV